MCLTITIGSAGLDTEALGHIARTVSAADIDFSVQGSGLLRRHTPRLAIHACDLLSDEADWNAPSWAMSEDGRGRLSGGLARLFAEMPGELTVAALWDGDRADMDTSISRDELLSLISANALGTKTRYVVGG